MSQYAAVGQNGIEDAQNMAEEEVLMKKRKKVLDIKMQILHCPF